MRAMAKSYCRRKSHKSRKKVRELMLPEPNSKEIALIFRLRKASCAPWNASNSAPSTSIFMKSITDKLFSFMMSSNFRAGTMVVRCCVLEKYVSRRSKSDAANHPRSRSSVKKFISHSLSDTAHGQITLFEKAIFVSDSTQRG